MVSVIEPVLLVLKYFLFYIYRFYRFFQYHFNYLYLMCTRFILGNGGTTFRIFTLHFHFHLLLLLLL